MIHSKIEYNLTKAWAEKFEEHAANVAMGKSETFAPPDSLRQAVIEALKGQAETLRAELAVWDALTEEERWEIIGRGYRS